jgi:hypothetical protein
MADNFNLRSFLTENKLTKNAQLLKEGSDYGYEAAMDAVDNMFEPGTPENEQLTAAVEKAFHENNVDTTNFGHEMGAVEKEVEAIAREIGLYEAKEEMEEEVAEEVLSERERKLVAIVENALGVAPQAVAEEVPISEEVMVDEQPLPKYENIEKLMQEIEAGTNEAAHSYKMKRMKEIAEMLEAKVGSLEEGEGADFVDAKKVKQMKKDIMTLRKHAEKLEKEYDKKFGEKESPKKAKKENLQEALKDSTNKFEEFTYDIFYKAPKGYVAIGKGEIKSVINPQFFNTSDEAKEHAELEISGYLGY